MSKFMPFILILILILTGCKMLPKRREPPPEQKTPLAKEQPPSKMMAQSYFEEGMSSYLKGEMDKAITSFAEALKLDPEHSKARKMFEESLKKRAETKERPTKEREEVGEVLPPPKAVGQTPRPRVGEEETVVKVAKEPKEVTTPPKMEEIPKEKLPPPEEEKRKRPTVEVISQEELRWFEFAKDLKRRGMYDDAITELNRLLDEYPKTGLADKIIYTRAETHIVKKEYPEAEKDCQTLIDDYPQSPLLDDARLMIADSYLLRTEYDQALLRYLRLTRDLRDSMKTLVLEEEAKEEAITPLSQSKEILAAKAQLGVAECYRLKKNYLDALIEYYEVVRSYSDRGSRAQALYYIGYIYDFINEVRDFKRAVAAYEQVLENYPESIWASYAKERKEYIERNYL